MMIFKSKSEVGNIIGVTKKSCLDELQQDIHMAEEVTKITRKSGLSEGEGVIHPDGSIDIAGKHKSGARVSLSCTPGYAEGYDAIFNNN